MSKARRLGVILIILGLFVPSVLYPLASTTRSADLMQVVLASKGAGYTPRWNELEIVIRNGVWVPEGQYGGHYNDRVALPYHHVMAIGVTVFFLGVAFTTLGGRSRDARPRDKTE